MKKSTYNYTLAESALRSMVFFILYLAYVSCGFDKKYNGIHCHNTPFDLTNCPHFEVINEEIELFIKSIGQAIADADTDFIRMYEFAVTELVEGFYMNPAGIAYKNLKLTAKECQELYKENLINFIKEYTDDPKVIRFFKDILRRAVNKVNAKSAVDEKDAVL